MSPEKELPQLETLQNEPQQKESTFFWNQPDDVLRETLEPFVEAPETLIQMTTEQLQAEIRKMLKNSSTI